MKNIDILIENVLREYKTPPMKLTKKVEVSPELEYHLQNNISLTENMFRIYSDKYFQLIN